MRTLNKLAEMKNKVVNKVDEKCIQFMTAKSNGIDGLLVTVGLCIIALLLCVVMKTSLSTFITNIVTDLETKAGEILDLKQ